MKKLALVLLAVSVVVAGSIAALRAAGPDPLRVGAIYPLSGSQGPGGMEEYRGVQLAADLANDARGVNGHPVRIVPVDVSGPDAAGGAVDLLAREGVRFVLGSYGTTISVPAAAGPVAEGSCSGRRVRSARWPCRHPQPAGPSSGWPPAGWSWAPRPSPSWPASSRRGSDVRPPRCASPWQASTTPTAARWLGEPSGRSVRSTCPSPGPSRTIRSAWTPGGW